MMSSQSSPAPASPRVHSPGLSMGRFNRVMDHLSDGVNAIVVKELRQAVRSRFMLAAIHLLLIAQLGVVGMFLLTNLGDDTFAMGRHVFMTLHLFLFAICVLFVPLYVGVRFGAERARQNVDMLYVTTLRPMSIIWGKFLCGAMLTTLLFSTAGPFMVLTYMLRGIDVLSVAVILTMDFLVVITAVQAMLLLTALASSPVARLGAAVLYVIGVMYAVGAMGGFSYRSLYFGGLGDVTFMQAIWTVIATLAITVAVHLGLMLASAAMISAPTSNRALGIRLYFTGLWGLGALVMLGVSLYHQDRVPLVLWGAIGFFFFIGMTLVGACERDRLGVRVQATIPRRWWLRGLAFLFYSGSAGGVLWATLMAALSLGVCMAMDLSPIDWPRYGYSTAGDLLNMLVFGAYSLAYVLTAGAIVRYLGRGRLRTELTLGLVLGMLAVGTLVPAIVVMVIDPSLFDTQHNFWTIIGNPMAAMMQPQYAPILAVISGAWLVAALAVCIPWFLGQVRAFVPVEGKRASDMLAGTGATPQARPADDGAPL